MNKQMHTYTDQELCTLMAGTEYREAAFREFYSRHARRIYQYCVRFVGRQAAEDIFQEVFERFLPVVEQHKELSNPPGFIMRIARNLCLNYKNRTNTDSIEFTEETMHPYNPAKDQESVELDALINSALELLPGEQKEAFILQQYCDMSYQEIAQEQEVPLTTVRNRVVRAKRKLREILSRYLEDYSSK
jgi:RNA polymerase sigma-70 factor (ECF subfamily)